MSPSSGLDHSRFYTGSELNGGGRASVARSEAGLTPTLVTGQCSQGQSFHWTQGRDKWAVGLRWNESPMELGLGTVSWGLARAGLFSIVAQSKEDAARFSK